MAAEILQGFETGGISGVRGNDSGGAKIWPVVGPATDDPEFTLGGERVEGTGEAGSAEVDRARERMAPTLNMARITLPTSFRPWNDGASREEET